MDKRNKRLFLCYEEEERERDKEIVHHIGPSLGLEKEM
jgi:hypothetical protein